MISIKRFLEQRRSDPVPKDDVVEALTQMVRLLLEAIATHMVRGNKADFEVFRRTLNALARQMEKPQSALSLLGVSSDAVEAFETYCHRTAAYFREQNEERLSMVTMLTDTVADLSGQADASVARLQAIEKQVERASELDDIRALRASLEAALRALREAVALQRSGAAAAVERLEGHIAMARNGIPGDPKHWRFDFADIDRMAKPLEPQAEPAPVSYVAAFKLQRAGHVASRFGEPARNEMLSTIGAQLKTVLGPSDRLLRWKGTSFVMFISSAETIQEIRARLSQAVAATGQQYIEVGRKSALLSVGVDWILFPQSDRPSLEAVFTEVDAFLANTGTETSSRVVMQR